MAEPLQPAMRVVILHGKDAFTMQERLRRFQQALTAAHGEVSREVVNVGAILAGAA